LKTVIRMAQEVDGIVTTCYISTLLSNRILKQTHQNRNFMILDRKAEFKICFQILILYPFRENNIKES
jgi:hypothetical protein